MNKYWIGFIFIFFILISSVNASEFNGTDLELYSSSEISDEIIQVSDNTQSNLSSINSENDFEKTENQLSSGEDKLSNPSESSLIVNPDFDDDLDGWSAVGFEIKNDGDEHGNYISSPSSISSISTNGMTADVSLSQEIDFTNIEKIGYYAKAGSSMSYIWKVFIGDVQIGGNNQLKATDWTYFEIDTTAFTGRSNLIIKGTITERQNMRMSDVPSFDSFNFTVKNVDDSSSNLIVNPDFDDDLDGWSAVGFEIKNDGDEHGNYISSPSSISSISTNGMTADVSLSQEIDFTNIEKIGYYAKAGSSMSYIWKVFIGDVQIGGNNQLKATDWTYFEIDTTAFTGRSNLIIKGTITERQNMRMSDVPSFDSFNYTAKKNEIIEVNTYINTPIYFNYTTIDNIDKWYWDFGDGTYSNDSNPIHIYKQEGTYDVTLTVSNNTDSKIINYFVEVIDKIIPDFEFTYSSNGMAFFDDTSSGNPVKWFWDFGDGTNTTYVVKPSGHDTYRSYPAKYQSYDVTLTITDKFGIDSSITKTITLKIYNTVPYPISIDSFENNTDGWTLSDGASISNDFHHDGEYSICIGHRDYIEKVINFDNIDAIEFYARDNITSGGLQYVQIYIDGNKVYEDSAHANVWTKFSYSTSNLAGNHTVRISASDFYVDKISLKTNSYYLANFTTVITDISGDDITVQFTDNSYGTYNAFLWTFDGENTSTIQNPTFTFKKGNHDVTLIIYRDGIKMSSITKNLNFDLPSIGDTSYATIQDAINAANASNVIDIPNIGYTFNENLVINKSMTLNFNGAVLSSKDASAPLFNITNGATVTLTNLGLNKDSTLVTDSNSKLIIKDSDIGVNLDLSEGNIDLLDDSFNNSVLTLFANTTIANSTISKGGVIVNGGKSKIFNTTFTGADVAITQTAGELDITSNLITDNNIGVNVTGGKTNMEYNLIYANAKFGLVYVGDNVSMDNNWWGNNFPQYETGDNLSDNYLDIFRQEAEREVEFNSWLELNVNTTTSIMGVNKEYPVTIDLTKNSDLDTINGYLKTITLDFVSDGGDVLNSATIENGIGQITLLTTSTDVKNVNITREGKNYALNSDIVSKTNVNIDVTGDLVAEGTANVVIEVPKATGNITIIIDGVSSTVALDNSQYALTMDNLTAGKHTIFVVYEGNDIFTSIYNSTSIDVTAKEIVTSTVKITGVDGNLTVTGILKDSKDNIMANEVISYQIGEGNIQNTTTNADGIFTLTGVNGATITVSYSGNDSVVGSNDSITLSDIASNEENNKTVSELENQLNEAQANVTKLAENLTDANAKVENLTAELADAQANASKLNNNLADANAKVKNLTAKLDEAQANATKLNGDLADANSKVENLTAELGEAQANVTKLTNDLADANAKVDNLTSELNQANITKLTNDLAEATQKVSNLTTQLEEAQANATKLNGNLVDANSKVENLTAELGEAQANATKLAGDIADANSKVENLTVELSEAQANATQLKGELEVANDKAVNLTAQLGEAQKQIQTLSADLISTTVAAKNLSIKALTNGNIQVTLKANGTALANKTVNVIINGVTYNGTTGEDGVAKITVKFASAGTYYATVTFAGDDTYKSSISTSKVVVSKKATKITAPKKSFKAKVKTKKVKITLKSGSTVLKSKKITLKVNGKTYTAKTNKKGVATIKVTKLTKKGTFKYTVKFAGDKAYKAISKKGKIIIK